MKIDINNIIKFLIKSPLIISMLGLFIVTACVYIFAALPIIDKNRAANMELKERKGEMEGFLANPPSRERITRLLKEKEALATQYLEMAKKMGFPRPPLLSFPSHFEGMEMEPLLDLFGVRAFHDYFEKELEERVRHLEDKHVVTIPSRLGFEEEGPKTPQALALLLAGVEAVERLITIAIDTGAREISSIEAPSPPYKEGITPEFKKLNIGLVLKADTVHLIEFLDRLTTGEYFFVIEEMEITSTTPPELEVKLSVSTQVFLGEEM